MCVFSGCYPFKSFPSDVTRYRLHPSSLPLQCYSRLLWILTVRKESVDERGAARSLFVCRYWRRQEGIKRNKPKCIAKSLHPNTLIFFVFFCLFICCWLKSKSNRSTSQPNASPSSRSIEPSNEDGRIDCYPVLYS